jgi:glycosyltransferase involved in cell wall biosynthesis
MKIAAFHNFLTQKRGAELAFFQMVTGLKKRGHEIDVYVFNISDYFSSQFADQEIPVINLNLEEHKKKNFLKGMFFYGRTYIALKRVSGTINRSYDVAFVHHYFLTPMILPFLTIPSVYYCEEVMRNYHEKIPGHIKQSFPARLIETYLEQHCVNCADLVLCNSDYMREVCMCVYGIFPVTVYLGVDNVRFQNRHATRENVLLSIGALTPLKNHDFIIRSVGCIPQERRPKLLIVGNGTTETISGLRTLANSLGVSLEIRISVTEDELITIYNSVKATAIAYTLEPFGLTALESLACETPVVAVREGGLRESVTPECGVLSERNEERFARALEYILNNPKAALEMGTWGRARVEELFSWDRCYADLEQRLLTTSKQKR